jgi:osmotically-inducible protein OsmY
MIGSSSREDWRHIHLESSTMKRPTRISTVLVAVLLTATLGCTSTAKQESTGSDFGDTVITTKVKAAMLNEPSLKSAEINVETYQNVVQLSGFVSTQANIVKAVEVARGVTGVKAVKNDMRLK